MIFRRKRNKDKKKRSLLNRILRIVSFTFIGYISLLLIASLVITTFFKGSIKNQIDAAMKKEIDADFHYDINTFSINPLYNFPNIRVSLGSYAVVGRNEFEGDTLVSGKSTSVVISLWSLIAGNPKLRGIYANGIKFKPKILKNGKANWDISLYKRKDEKDKEDDAGGFTASMRFWQVENAEISYQNLQTNQVAQIKNLNIKGNGSLSGQVYSLRNKLNLDKISYQNILGFSIDSDVSMEVDLKEKKYTFTESKIKINEYLLIIEGFLQELENKKKDKNKKDEVNLLSNITVKNDSKDLKNALSLLPFFVGENYKNLTAKGSHNFHLEVKGKLNSKETPKIKLKSKIKDGTFQYKGKPLSAKNINLDLDFDSEQNNKLDGKIKFQFGKNKVDLWGNVNDFRFIHHINFDLDILLSDLPKLLPLQNIKLGGNLAMKGGRHIRKEIPHSTNLELNLSKVFFTYKDAQIQEVSLIIKVLQSPKEEFINIEKFKLKTQNSIFQASGKLNNFEVSVNPTYTFKAKGKIDIGNLAKFFSDKNNTLQGVIESDLALKGDLENVNGSGFLKLQNIVFDAQKLGLKASISEAHASLAGQKIILDKCKGSLGKSQFSMTGSVSNYVPHLLKRKILLAKLNLSSDEVDLNELMKIGETTQKPKVKPKKNKKTKKVSPRIANQVLEIPKNIDFTLNSNIKKIDYAKVKLKNLKGKIRLKEGVLYLEKGGFDMLDAKFSANASYNPLNLQKPKFSLDFTVNKLSVQKSIKMFGNIEKISPMAKDISGFVSTQLAVKGELQQDMNPKIDKTLQGDVEVLISGGKMKNSKMIQNLINLAQLKGLEKIELEDVKVLGKIENGEVIYQPFVLRMGDYTIDIAGKNTLEGKLDFDLKLHIPKENIVATTRLALITLLGRQVGIGKDANIRFKVKGTYEKPDFDLLR